MLSKHNASQLALALAGAVSAHAASATETSLGKSALSLAEEAFLRGSPQSAAQVIRSSHEGLRPDVIRADTPAVLARVIGYQLDQQSFKDAQETAVHMQRLAPKETAQGVLAAFTGRKPEDFDKFCATAVWEGRKPYAGLRSIIEKPAAGTERVPADAAQLLSHLQQVESRDFSKAFLAAIAGLVGVAGGFAAEKANKRLLSCACAAAAMFGGFTWSQRLGDTAVGLWDAKNLAALACTMVAIAALLRAHRAVTNKLDED